MVSRSEAGGGRAGPHRRRYAPAPCGCYPSPANILGRRQQISNPQNLRSCVVRQSRQDEIPNLLNYV